jgi:tetratricopeptide (TPR) repeat protein
VTQLKSLADLEPTRVERRVRLGLTHAQQGHTELAVLTLRNALDSTPDHALVYGAIGQVWFQAAASGDEPTALNKAYEALERGTATEHASSAALTAYGRALSALGRLDAAERAFLLATERFPVDLDAFLEYAAIAERHNRLNAARTALIRYDALSPANEAAARSVSRAAQIGALSLQLQEPAAAAFWFERASNGAPRDLRLMADLAEVLLRSGDRDAARTTIARGLELDPSNEPLRALSRRM